MPRYLLRGAAVIAVSSFLVGITAGVSQAMGPTSTATLTSALSPPTIAPGGRANDTATVTGSAVGGAPTGSVTFWACGASANPTPCTSPNLGPVTVGLSVGGDDHSTAAVQISADTPGWYCFLDRYNGNGYYSPATDNDTATECLDVTSTPPPPTKTTPFLATAPGSQTMVAGSADTDTATVIGGTGTTPTGSVTFAACGPTATPAPCTTPNVAPVTMTLAFAGYGRAAATDTFTLNNPGWWCLVVTYSGDGNFNSVSDNSTNECVDVLPAPPPKSAPTFTTALSPPSVSVGGRAVDTATVTGNGVNGPPTGSVTFAACGPTATPTPCTSPNLGPVTVGLSFGGGDTSTARVVIDPGPPGWYCFLDRYNGDGHYTGVTDSDTATECLQVTSVTPPPPTKVTPTFTTALSSPSIPYGSEAVDTATVTGVPTNGTPTGSVTFAACGPRATPAPCTSPNLGPVTVGLAFAGNNSAVAAVTIIPGGPGWYCFADRYNGNGTYNAATDNDVSTECLDVTVSHGAQRNAGRSSATSSLIAGSVATSNTSSGPAVGRRGR